LLSACAGLIFPNINGTPVVAAIAIDAPLNDTLGDYTLLNGTLSNLSGMLLDDTLLNGTLLNSTLESGVPLNGTLLNGTLLNGTLLNWTLLNCTLLNDTLANGTLAGNVTLVDLMGNVTQGVNATVLPILTAAESGNITDTILSAVQEKGGGLAGAIINRPGG
jgi:hypothetical protein